MKRLLIIALFIILGGCTQVKSEVQRSEEGIVFMSRADSEQGELYYYNATSEEVVRLTENERHENNPSLSKDGKVIAFQAGEEANPLTWEIHILDITEGYEKILTSNNLIDAHPDWSPDGEKIVYSSFQNSNGNPAGTGDIFMMNSDDGGNKIILTNNVHENNDLEWSPDGSMIVFKSTRRKNDTLKDEIYVMNTNGTEVKRLTTTRGWNSDHDPSWSKDNDYIVFNRFEGSVPWTKLLNTTYFQNNYEKLTPWNVFRTDLKGNTERLTNTENLIGLPVYSRDGSEIMYNELEPIIINNTLSGFYHTLKTMNLNGTNHELRFYKEKHTYTLEYYDW